jgi:hypothetical protein
MPNKDLNICVCDTVAIVQKVKQAILFIVENIKYSIKEFIGFVYELLGELHIFINGPPGGDILPTFPTPMPGRNTND